jgi:hypothetical protein
MAIVYHMKYKRHVFIRMSYHTIAIIAITSFWCHKKVRHYLELTLYLLVRHYLELTLYLLVRHYLELTLYLLVRHYLELTLYLIRDMYLFE